MEQKDFIKDGMENDEIINIVKNIRRCIETDNNTSYENKLIFLQKEYPQFLERYPILFDISTRKETFDWNFFNYFMNMRSKIVNDELTSEKASIIVGQNAYDKYVKKEDVNKKRKC